MIFCKVDLRRFYVSSNNRPDLFDNSGSDIIFNFFEDEIFELRFKLFNKKYDLNETMIQSLRTLFGLSHIRVHHLV